MVLAALVLGGCGVEALQIRAAPSTPYDVVIVPGCPSNDDGSLTRCQMGRALWAAILWERGYTKAFITSGAAVHTPYVEAEALAAAMAALGVPPERIYVEPNALHTDENMYFSMQIARALGAERVAVASSRGHAGWACRMLSDWGQPCGAFAMDEVAVEKRATAALFSVRSKRAIDWVGLAERERRLRATTGCQRRPQSFLLYASLGLRRTNGETWVPCAPRNPTVRSWRALVQGVSVGGKTLQ